MAKVCGGVEGQPRPGFKLTMPELILAIHHGPHDAAAAVLVDYELKAAVQVERLSRVKGDGSYPDLSIEETLDMVGATRRDVDVLALSRDDFPVNYFRHFHGWRWLREQWRTHLEGKKLRSMARETRRANSPHVEDFFDVSSMRRDCGSKPCAITMIVDL